MLGHRYGVGSVLAPASDRLQFTAARGSTEAELARSTEREPGRAARRFRVAHLALLGQGLVIGILGGFALAWSMANLHFGPEGTPILGLSVTPLHGGLLMACGSLAVLACLGRWTTLAFSVIAAAGWTGLTIVCAIGAAHHAPGVLGFDPRDTLLYGVLGAYDLIVFALLLSARSALRP